jgi:hypothetical protein
MIRHYDAISIHGFPRVAASDSGAKASKRDRCRAALHLSSTICL